MPNASIQTIPSTIKWRDVIHLDMPDPDLKKRTEAFLDKLEHSVFRSKNPKTGDVDEVSGQAILQSMKARKEFLAQHSDYASVVQQASGQLHLPYVNGKLTISGHDRLFDGREINGSNTAFFNDNGLPFPVAIQIGQDYLKGARYLGQDMRYHPVQLEGVIANELAHAANRSPENPMSDRIENAVLVGLGGVPRVLGKERIQFVRGQNGDYQSLIPSKSSAKKVGALDASDDNLHIALAQAAASGVAPLSVAASSESLFLPASSTHGKGAGFKLG